MSSAKTNCNFIEKVEKINFDTTFDKTPEQCVSLDRVGVRRCTNVSTDFLTDSNDDLLSCASDFSGINSFSNKKEIHSSMVQRIRHKGGKNDRFNDTAFLKNLSLALSEDSDDDFSFSKKSKKDFLSFPSDPIKILDVPGVEDEYYSNLLSWSKKNKISIVLENTIYLFDFKTSDIDEFYQAYDIEKVTSVVFDPSGEKIAFGNILGQVAIWDVARKKEILCIERHRDRVSCLDWSEKGLLTGSKDKSAFFCDIRAKKSTNTKFSGHTQEVCGIKWNIDNSYFATGGNDNKAFAWDLKKPVPIMTLNHKAGVKALCWSSNDRDVLITGGGHADRMIRSWNISKEKLVFSRDIGAQVCGLLFSKNLNDIVSAKGGPDNDIEVWRANGLKKVGTFSGHTERPLYMAWSPDQNTLLSVSSDETMRFWDVSRKVSQRGRASTGEMSSIYL